MKRRLTLRLKLALLVALTPAALRAECIPGGVYSRAPIDRDFHLLFTGTVTRVGPLTVSFEVDRVWSGAVQSHMTLFLLPGMEVHSPSFFVKGMAYFVDAHDAGVRATFSDNDVREGMPVYSISFCSETGLLANDRVRENIKNLGRGRPPRA